MDKCFTLKRIKTKQMYIATSWEPSVVQGTKYS